MTDITIITPAYNPGELILETYKSLEKQTFRNFEWIIVDDNSDKKNRLLIEGIKDKATFSVIVIRNSVNFRQAKSKNIGLAQAKGKYVKFLDADDLLDVEHLQNQYILLLSTENTNVAIYSPTFNFIENVEKGKTNETYKSVPKENIKQLERFLVFPFFHHCSCLIRKECIDSVNGFDDKLITDEDGDFIHRLMLNGVLFLPEENSKYYYRQHDYNSRVSSNNSYDKWMTRLAVCLKVENLLIDKYQILHEPLAQRLDLLGMSCMNYSEELSEQFFINAKRIYPNYSVPGKLLPKILRIMLGKNRFLKLKNVIKR